MVVVAGPKTLVLVNIMGNVGCTWMSVYNKINICWLWLNILSCHPQLLLARLQHIS